MLFTLLLQQKLQTQTNKVCYLYMTAKNETIQATLTGSDGPVSGTAKPIHYAGFSKAYEFLSIDENLHLIIALNDDGKWLRVAGTDPYFSGWIGELAEQIPTPVK